MSDTSNIILIILFFLGEQLRVLLCQSCPAAYKYIYNVYFSFLSLYLSLFVSHLFFFFFVFVHLLISVQILN